MQLAPLSQPSRSTPKAAPVLAALFQIPASSLIVPIGQGSSPSTIDGVVALIQAQGMEVRPCRPRGGGKPGRQLPRRGLALLEIIGPRGVPPHRFWVAVRQGSRGREFFDPEAGGDGATWMTTKQWQRKALPRHLGRPGRKGLFCAVGIEVVEPHLQGPPSEEKEGETMPPIKETQHDPRAVQRLMTLLTRTLKAHRISLVSPPDPREADVGPRWVRAYVRLDAGQSIRALRNLSEDIARAVGTLTSDIHIVNLPERHAVGIDLPVRGLGYQVDYDDLIHHPSWALAKSEMTLGIPGGIDGAGLPVWVDLADMPHMLVGGTTGSGKTVFLRTLLLTLVLQHGPESLRLILSSGKPMDFRAFEALPHVPEAIAQTPEQALEMLRDLTAVMNRRILLIDEEGHDNLAGYNASLEECRRLPRIVAVLDEYGDMVMSFDSSSERRKFEGYVGRLAQKARAAGIHLVLCMQRPDRKVLKGVIKSNILHRFALKLPQQTESRIILDTSGAEALLGQGDMIYKDGRGRLQRLQVPFLEGGGALRARLAELTEGYERKGEGDGPSPGVVNGPEDSNSEAVDLEDRGVAAPLEAPDGEAEGPISTASGVISTEEGVPVPEAAAGDTPPEAPPGVA